MYSPAPQDKGPFSEEVIARLEREGLTIRWRYGYKLANRFEVKRICAGGMGVVYMVEDLFEKGKRYAAKTLKAYFRKPETEEEWERWRRSADDFLKECNIWVDLGKHRHIVEAEFLDKVEGVPLVMSEFIDGGGLDDLLESGPLDITTALDFAIQACIGMEYANKRGVIVHRDIKPGNILVTKDGVAKVNDFGIAKAVESAEAISPEAGLRATFNSASPYVTRGTGTPGYMAPEQFSEVMLNYMDYPIVPLGRGADIYAFGLVLYEMIAGMPAVETESDREAEILREASNVVSHFDLVFLYGEEYAMRYAKYFLKTLKVKPPSPSKNERLNAIIFKCLEKHPSDRYQSFTELRDDLMQVYREQTGRDFHIVEEPAYEPSWRNRAKTYWVLGREKESFECYDKALEQDPANTSAWLEKGLASAEVGNLEEFGICMEIASYIAPSREPFIQHYKEVILGKPEVHPRDIKFLDRLVLDYAVSNRLRDWVLRHISEAPDPFREPNPAMSKLLEKLKSEDEDDRVEAAEELGKLGEKSALPALVEALRDEWPFVREEAASALGELGDNSATPFLIEALKDGRNAVRMRAALALGKLGDRSVIPAVIEALGRGNTYARWKAAEALLTLGDISAVPALIEALKDSAPLVQITAARALAKFGDWSAVPALLDALEKEVELRDELLGEIAKLCMRLGDRSFLPKLIELLKYRDPDDYRARDVRLAAVKALGQLGDKSAVRPLIEALKDEDAVVRHWAVQALGELGDRSAVPPLLEALEGGDEDMRGAAAEALGKIGDRSVVPALLEFLKHKQFFRVSEAVISALGKLGDRSAVQMLIEALDYEDSYYLKVRLLAALRWICSKPEKAKMSKIKDKLKEYSALEWNNKGSELLAVEDYEGALKCFEKAIGIDPDWAVPRKGYDEAQHWVNEMNFEWTLKDIERHYEGVAIRRFDIALSKDPRNVAALVGKGEALIRLNRYKEAIRCLDAALEIDPSNSDAQVLKASALMKLEEVERAHEATEKKSD